MQQIIEMSSRGEGSQIRVTAFLNVDRSYLTSYWSIALTSIGLKVEPGGFVLK